MVLSQLKYFLILFYSFILYASDANKYKMMNMQECSSSGELDLEDMLVQQTINFLIIDLKAEVSPSLEALIELITIKDEILEILYEKFSSDTKKNNTTLAIYFLYEAYKLKHGSKKNNPEENKICLVKKYLMGNGIIPKKLIKDCDPRTEESSFTDKNGMISFLIEAISGARHQPSYKKTKLPFLLQPKQRQKLSEKNIMRAIQETYPEKSISELQMILRIFRKINQKNQQTNISLHESK